MIIVEPLALDYAHQSHTPALMERPSLFLYSIRRHFTFYHALLFLYIPLENISAKTKDTLLRCANF